MSTVAIVLIVLGVVFLLLFIGGFVAARRRIDRPEFDADVAKADQALEAARAEDRGWDREVLHSTAEAALRAERPAFQLKSLDLVLVDDRPGMHEDRAHLMALGEGESVRVILARDAEGRWAAEQVE